MYTIPHILEIKPRTYFDRSYECPAPRLPSDSYDTSNYCLAVPLFVFNPVIPVDACFVIDNVSSPRED